MSKQEPLVVWKQDCPCSVKTTQGAKIARYALFETVHSRAPTGKTSKGK
jgi:hypothetical protein